MILRFCLSILVLVHLSAATCGCYKNNQTDPPGAVYTPAGPRDNETYMACYPTNGSCSYFGKTTNESVSLCNIQFTSYYSPTRNDSMRIVIMDGSTVAFNLTPADLTSAKKIELAAFESTTSELDVTMTFLNNLSDGQISFYFYTCPKPVNPTRPPTTTGQTFPTISGASSTPGLIGADIAFAFVSAGYDLAMFNQTTEAIKTSVNSLNVVQWSDNPTPIGVRLGLLAPSLTDKPNTFGDQWNLGLPLFTALLGALPQMIGIDNSNWIPALEAFLGNGSYFDPGADVRHKPRANVQKIFVFFTQTSPAENLTDLTESLNKLVTRDVHMVVIDVRSTPDDKMKMLANANIPNFAYMNMINNTDFLFNYVLRSDYDSNYGCTYKTEDRRQEIPSSDPGLTLSWPLKTTPENANAQYCNNQESVLNLWNKDPNTINLCVNIPSYELETGMDYLNFYDADGKEIASFTGIDVVGSKFLIPGNETQVVFKTNENTIYKGVEFTIISTSKTDSKSCEF